MIPALQSPRPTRLFGALLALLAAGLIRAQTPAAQPNDIDTLFHQQGLPAPEGFDPVRLSSFSSSHYFLHKLPAQGIALVFLPPKSPALHTPLRLRSPLDTGVPPPPELAAHVADIFYPQLAARLAADDLPRRLRLKLETYRATKAALQEELRALLARTRESRPADRLAALSACAREQAPRLDELESGAERLRIELGTCTPAGDLGCGDNGEQPSPAPPPPDAPLMRAAAFFLEGLGPAQRRLLRAVADESDDQAAPATPATTVFIAPEGASLRLPADLPPGTRNAIEAFTTARRTLAIALLNTIRDPHCSPARLRELAAEQAPALAALDAQADEIRLALQTIPELPGLGPHVLPAELTERLSSYRERKKSLFRELYGSITDRSRHTTSSTGRNRNVAVPATVFTPDQQAKLAALNAEKNALRTALAEHRRDTGATADRKSIDTLIEEFERARQLQELREQYRDYRIALLEPGLAPAQRRLLFDAALQALALPLPFGESLRQP